MTSVARVSDEGTSYCIAKPEVFLGRSETCDVQIESRFASKKHAVIRQTGNSFVLEDLHSRNGTIVNRIVIERPFNLRDGDEITMGRIRWRFSGGALQLTGDAQGNDAQLPEV